MNVHITNIYGFIHDQNLRKKQNQFADAAHALGFKEMGIFNFDVSTDTENELSKRIDGIISSLQFNDLVFVQLPTGNGEHYDNFLINKIKAYNTKVCVLLHQTIEYEYVLNAADLIMPTNNEVHAYLKEHNYSNVFYKKNINYEFSMISNSSNVLSSDFYIKKYLIDAVDQLEEPVLSEDVIHIGFGLHDKDGHYSVWVGTAMQSILEHTDSKICFHILHDETVSEENKRKLKQVAHQKGDVIEFHQIDSAEFECIKDRTQGFTIGTMFRCMLPELLPDLSKIVYLDADIFVNTDIKELWEFDICDYCLAGVVDEGVIKFHTPNILYKYPKIDRNQYFNAGVLCMNLTKIKQIGNLRDLVVEFLVNNPEATYPDQDAFNVLFHNNILYLDSSWNQFVYSHREENIDTLNPGIYHFAADVLVVYSNSKIDMEYFKTLCRTPWSDYEIENRIGGCVRRLNDRINQYEKMIYRLSMPKVKHIFYGEENFMLRKLYNSIDLGEDDYRVMKLAYNQDDDILPCKDLEALKEESGPIIIFVLYESDNYTAIQNLEELGYINGEDFFVAARFLSFLDGGFA
ncbi:glycosyltransferase [Holdemanella biformis]|uniref:glycosyltransferase n=1 Tax=Holdemanella biformis TaxID=1735 RepID=UPI0022E139EE|nr:glycosyltransferase [Holdemanella biformis]